jgi:hypothetical protein
MCSLLVRLVGLIPDTPYFCNYLKCAWGGGTGRMPSARNQRQTMSTGESGENQKLLMSIILPSSLSPRWLRLKFELHPPTSLPPKLRHCACLLTFSDKIVKTREFRIVLCAIHSPSPSSMPSLPSSQLIEQTPYCLLGTRLQLSPIVQSFDHAT